ncbi:MAG: N-acetylmuramoyl-L-alanine amidase, partial [Bacteroidetes bacterium]|nr:N-acetylmuramoyl-L-alanine amidase [Bacteroidota bacterium]
GIETYILNWTDDEEAMKVAARENAISLKEMKRLRDELSIILASLENESKRDESIKVAGYVHQSMVAGVLPDYLQEYNRGLKQALFYVLVGAKMPAALLEVGFISNPFEEKMLGNEIYRLNLANSIVSGILKYFSESPVKMLITQEESPDSRKNKTVPVKYSNIKK